MQTSYSPRIDPALSSCLISEVWLIVLVWVILISTLLVDVVIIVHLSGLLLSMSLGLNSVVLVPSLSLSKLVNLSTGKASEKFLGERVVDDLSFLALLVFEEFHTLESGSTSDEFMREFALVLWFIVTTIDLLVSISAIVCGNSQ